MGTPNALTLPGEGGPKPSWLLISKDSKVGAIAKNRPKMAPIDPREKWAAAVRAKSGCATGKDSCRLDISVCAG